MMFSLVSLLFLTLFHSPSVTTATNPAPEITPLDIKMSSTYKYVLFASYCIDGSTTNEKVCATDVNGGTFPWITLVIPRSIVRKVRITNPDVEQWSDNMENMKIWVGNDFPSSPNEEYTGGALMGTFKGPGKLGEVVEITSKTGVEGTHVVVQMKTHHISLSEIEVFGEPVPDTARCIDTGCQKAGLGEDVESECIYLKNVNWTSISHIYNVSTPWKEGLCKGADFEEDCCKCLPRLPVGCVDVEDACKDAFGGLGVCKNFVKDDMSTIDFEQGSKKDLCNADKPDCCECFSLKETTTTKP